MGWLTNFFVGIFKTAKAFEETVHQVNKTIDELSNNSKKSADKFLKDVEADVEKRKKDLEQHILEDLRRQNLRRQDELKQRLEKRIKVQKKQDTFISTKGHTEQQKRDRASERVFGSTYVKYRSSKHSKQKQKDSTQPNITYKDLYKSIPLFLNSKGITKLFHFTDVRNLSSIIQSNGLYSWYGLKQQNISAYHSSNDVSRELDLRKHLHNYVRLTFTNYHPMTTILVKEQGRHIVWLEIDLDVGCWKGTLYSDRNATDGQVNVSKEFEFLKQLDFDVFKKQYWELEPAGKKRYQAEVLVENFLPLHYITNLDNLTRRYL